MGGLGSDPEFIALLRTADVVAMHTQEASLDDVFIAVAGGGA